MDRTLAIVKPDAVGAGHAGQILARLEDEGFRILGLRRMHLTTAQAQEFYAVHKERPFYGSLVEFMTSGPAIAVALEGEDAVPRLRTVMGATNPEEADEGTLRKEFATSIERNAIHGSDSAENATLELGFFFGRCDLLS